MDGVDIDAAYVRFFISTLTLAELAAGPAAATNEFTAARRRARLTQAEAAFHLVAFDGACAEAYGRVCLAVAAVGRKVGGSRSLDLMLAATALARGLPFYTLNVKDLRGLERLVEIVDLRSA